MPAKKFKLDNFEMKNTNKIKKIILIFSVSILSVGFFGFKNAEASPGYSYEGAVFYAYSSSDSGKTAVYRFYNNKTGDHLLTASSSEKDKLINNSGIGYAYEGVAFYAYGSSGTGRVAVYRFYNDSTGDHLLTASTSEKDKLMADSSIGYTYEGVVFYVHNSAKDGSVPVYRFYNDGTGDHLLTSSDNEERKLMTANNSSSLLGSDITVGLWSYTRDEIKDDPFEIEANKNYRVKDSDGKILAVIAGGEKTKVTYDGDKKLKIYGSITSVLSESVVYFEAADGNDENMIFDAHKPSSSLDEYRGKIKLRYSDDSQLIWVINTLPLEHYVWGDGELAGTGDMNHNRVMVVSFRTYGYWKLLYSTKYAKEGFKVNATPGNQLYKGYSYEKEHPRVKQAAEDTRGKIVTYKGEVAITPYSSWTDGRTRSFEERWGSDEYPWCQSVDDPYGDYNGDYWDNSYKSTAELVEEGNHMVGLSAHGSLTLAEEKSWDWERILHYYFKDVDISEIY
ncbi:MAG: SpoIID/LytB domain-containing protein [Candidatus Moranbacteria bacterium]|nr:SpoIID/LytB domain-containing protein [Candidatus Moranbacteria bacterium]